MSRRAASLRNRCSYWYHIDYDEYVGRIAVGRIDRGVVNQPQVVIMETPAAAGYMCLKGQRVEAAEVSAGDIVMVSASAK